MPGYRQHRVEDEEPRQRQKGPNQYNRKKKLRSNKRADGTIYTTKHPRHVPAEQRNVGEEGDSSYKYNADVQYISEAHADTARHEIQLDGGKLTQHRLTYPSYL